MSLLPRTTLHSDSEQFFNESSREFTGSYWAAQETSYIKPRGPLGSSPLRSDGSCNGQAGEAGLVEQCSAKAKSLKLRAKGLSGCHPSGQQPRQPDRGPEGRIKDYSHDNLLKEQPMGKKQMVKEKLYVYEKKGKTLTLCSNLELAGGMMSSLMKM
jgi:hypothetical protein